MNTQIYSLFLIIWLCLQVGAASCQSLEAYREGQVLTFSEKNRHWFLLQDRQGFLWGYNEQYEIVRFDGSGYHTFLPDPDDAASIGVAPSSPPWIKEDREGHLWIVDRTGMDRYDPETGNFEHLHDRAWELDSMGSSYFQTLLEDSRGNFWMGTQTGIYLWLTAPDSLVKLGAQHAWHLFEDKQGDIWHWMGSPGGPTWLAKIDPNSLEKTDQVELNTFDFQKQAFPFVRQGPKTAQYPGKPDTFLLLLRGKLHAFDPDSVEAEWISGNLLEDELIYALYQEDQTIIVGTNRNRILEFQPATGSFSEFLVLDPGPYEEEGVIQIFKSREGILWVVTTDRTFQVLPQKPAIQFKNLPESRRPYILSSRFDDLVSLRGTVYFNTTQGLLPVLDQTGKQPILLEFSDEDFKIPEAFDKNRKGRGGNLHETSNFIFQEDSARKKFWLLLGQYPFGLKLIEYNEQGRKMDVYYCRGRGMACFNDSYNDITIDRNGHLWMAGWVGLAHVDPQTYCFENFRDSLNGVNIYSVLADDEGQIWIGYTNRGVSRFDPRSGTFTHFMNDPKDPGSLISNLRVNDMMKDSRGNIWIASDGGISRWSPESAKFARYNRETGLPTNVFYALLEDGKGKIWAISEKHLCLYNPGKDAFWAFGKEDGLPAFSQAIQSALADQEGFLFIRTLDDRLIYFPSSALAPDTLVAPLFFTDILVGNQSIRLSKTSPVQLAFGQRNFSIHYAALEYLHAEKVRFLYKLEGYHREWQPAGNQREVSFTNLGPGKYTFLLKCINRHGFESKEPIAMQIHILPPGTAPGLPGSSG